MGVCAEMFMGHSVLGGYMQCQSLHDQKLHKHLEFSPIDLFF